jgi:hypothetical protein
MILKWVIWKYSCFDGFTASVHWHVHIKGHRTEWTQLDGFFVNYTDQIERYDIVALCDDKLRTLVFS